MAARAPEPKPNTYWIEVRGSGTAECDGLYCPSKEGEAVSESGTKSSVGYWNGKMAWDRADGKAARSPSLSYSNSYKAWRIARLDGHLAYTIVTEDDELPPTAEKWDVYRKGEAPAPEIAIHQSDPRDSAKGSSVAAKETCFAVTPNVVFVLGGPGAGKGTVCELAQIQLGWSHLSAGDLLRAERASGGPSAKLIEEFIVAGKIVPVEITVSLIKKEMARLAAEEGKSNFLIDGFPRNQDNIDGWEKVMGADARVAFIFFFECPLAELEKRILGRAKYSGRSDDNVESLRKRFAVYKEETMPVIEAFRKMGFTDGSGASNANGASNGGAAASGGHSMVVEVDTSKPKTEVWAEVKGKLAMFTDAALASAPLTERSEMLLGLRPYPPREKRASEAAPGSGVEKDKRQKKE